MGELEAKWNNIGRTNIVDCNTDIANISSSQYIGISLYDSG